LDVTFPSNLTLGNPISFGVLLSLNQRTISWS
jgi:hypothetical protein